MPCDLYLHFVRPFSPEKKKQKQLFAPRFFTRVVRTFLRISEWKSKKKKKKKETSDPKGKLALKNKKKETERCSVNSDCILLACLFVCSDYH